MAFFPPNYKATIKEIEFWKFVMTRAFQTGSANKIKVYTALLTKGSRTAPVNVSITVGAAGGALVTEEEIGVTALTGPIAKGTPLDFSGGTRAYLAADAATGATTLTVEPLSGAVADAETATFTAKSRLNGGTSANLDLGNTSTDVIIFEDDNGYQDGAVTSASWSIPWSGQRLLDDQSFDAISYNARNAVTGQEIYVWIEHPAPTGFTTGETFHGPAIIEGFTQENPSDGLLTYSCTFKGRGTPNYDRPAA